MPEIYEVQTATFKMKAAETTLNFGCCAVLDTATEGQVTRPAAANAGNIAGVLRETSHAAGATAKYQISGYAKCAISEAVAIGDKLIVANVAGQVKPAGTGAHSSGVGKVGVARSAATTAGSLVVVLLTIPNEYGS